ncbi:LIN1-like protein [Naviculisporaceae sp. PSN 640]
MASRFSAARPKRASEAFARAHHGTEQDGDGDSSPLSSGKTKKVKFDVRNPSALAPSAQDNDDDGDDEVLAADVIGGTRALKRGAVNIDGYDSDSDNENFDDRAEARVKKGKEAEDVDFNEKMDNYGKPGESAQKDEDGDEEIDMFGDADDDDDQKPAKKAKKSKEVRFLDEDEIEGQEGESKSGGHVRFDDDNGSSSDDDEEDIAAAIAEEDVDEEVGAGGLKKHAPKIDAFNMRQEQEEGRFDEAGNYIRKAADANEVHDRWLEGVSKKEIKKAAAAQEKRDAERRKQQLEDDRIMTSDLLKKLIVHLELGETALEALARLGKGMTKPKKVPKWKQKKLQQKAANGADDAMDVDTPKSPEDVKQAKLKESVGAITEAADKLLGRDYPNIYDTEREGLIREYRNQTGEEWVEPPKPVDEEENQQKEEEKPAVLNGSWEFRWVDGRDATGTQGPFDSQTMKAWQDAGYFPEGAVEFRPAGADDEWTKTATFV